MSVLNLCLGRHWLIMYIKHSIILFLLLLALAITIHFKVEDGLKIEEIRDLKIELHISDSLLHLKDSLHREHLKTCSFINKDLVYVDKWGDWRIEKPTNYIK